jgi:hypothetical protein
MLLISCRANLSDPSNVVIDVDYRIPAPVIKGEYKAQGKIAGFPIGGKGVYNISMRKDYPSCGGNMTRGQCHLRGIAAGSTVTRTDWHCENGLCHSDFF